MTHHDIPCRSLVIRVTTTTTGMCEFASSRTLSHVQCSLGIQAQRYARRTPVPTQHHVIACGNCESPAREQGAPLYIPVLDKWRMSVNVAMLSIFRCSAQKGSAAKLAHRQHALHSLPRSQSHMT
jgi:hypothetical protein